MSWRSDVALGKYGKLPRALIDKSMFPNVEVDYGSFAVACPCCGLQIPEKCPVCNLDFVYDDGGEG